MMSMTEEEFQVRLNLAAEHGAMKVLAKLGLEDVDDAKVDIKNLRELLDTWGELKRTAVREVTSWFFKGIVFIFLLGLAGAAGFNFGIGGK